jgi:hypothetical protein
MGITLLIYMAADNDLDPAARNDLESIRQASLYSDMDIVVQLDRWEFVDAKEGFRYHFKGGEESLIKELGEVNSGSPVTLKTFIEESAKAYPSDKLMVVIWSHGSGVDDRDFYDKSSKRELMFVEKEEIEEIAISFDDASRDFLDNIELQKALDVDVPIAVLGLDACLMGMFEIAYQLKDQAGLMVASQHIEPASGWPYMEIVEGLHGDDSVEEMGVKIVQFYGEYYQRSSEDTTQSAYLLEEIACVAVQIDRFAKILRENLPNPTSLKHTLSQTQGFSDADYIDLVNFVKKIQERETIEGLASIATALLDSLERLILANQTFGRAVEDAHGVSIYFPHNKSPFRETFELYEKLDFSRDYPEWIALIRWYYQAT